MAAASIRRAFGSDSNITVNYGEGDYATPRAVLPQYGRAGMEPRICELREDFALRKIPTASFAANALYLDDRSLNIDTFDPIYVLMVHALPEAAQSPPFQRVGFVQTGVHPQISNRRETAHPSGGVSFGFAIWPD